MSITITKQGTLPSKQVFAGACNNCGTQFRCHQEDGKLYCTQRDGEWLELPCPLCKKPVYANRVQVFKGLDSDYVPRQTER